MNPVSTQNWFLKCGIAAALSLLVYAAIAICRTEGAPVADEP